MSSKVKVVPPLDVDESMLEVPSTCTCDLSSGDEDECDDVYTSDESSDDCDEDDE